MTNSASTNAVNHPTRGPNVNPNPLFLRTITIGSQWLDTAANTTADSVAYAAEVADVADVADAPDCADVADADATQPRALVFKQQPVATHHRNPNTSASRTANLSQRDVIPHPFAETIPDPRVFHQPVSHSRPQPHASPVLALDEMSMGSMSPTAPSPASVSSRKPEPVPLDPQPQRPIASTLQTRCADNRHELREQNRKQNGKQRRKRVWKRVVPAPRFLPAGPINKPIALRIGQLPRGTKPVEDRILNALAICVLGLSVAASAAFGVLTVTQTRVPMLDPIVSQPWADFFGK